MASFETMSFVILCVAVVGAPWLRTPVSPGALRIVELGLIAGAATWLATLAIGRRAPPWGGGAVVAVMLTLAWGWLLAANAKSVYDEKTLRLMAQSQRLVGWPGSVDRNASVAVVRTFTLLVLGAAALIDLLRRISFRRMLAWGLAVNGAVLGLLGTLDRFEVGPIGFPQLSGEGSHFGPFAYHANAAAYMNLCLPASIALVASTTRGPRRLAFGLLAATSLGCLFHASKAGLVLTAVAVAVFVATLGRMPFARSRAFNGGRVRIGIVAVGALALWANLARWRAAATEPSSLSARFSVWRITADMWRDSSGGIGPGGFKIAFPAEAAKRDPDVFGQWIVSPWRPGSPTGLWMHVHNDPLELLVEWGLPGAVLGAFVVVYAVRALRSSDENHHPRLIASHVALGVVGLHALIDFPLQILSVQLIVIAWLAIGIGEANRGRPTPPNLVARGGGP